MGAMRRALSEAAVPPSDIVAVCIGLAGGGTDWDPHIVKAITPGANVVCAGDLKIALAGARGECQGVVVLAGTGCAAYGINATGDNTFVGGLGYLLVDKFAADPVLPSQTCDGLGSSYGLD